MIGLRSGVGYVSNLVSASMASFLTSSRQPASKRAKTVHTEAESTVADHSTPEQQLSMTYTFNADNSGHEPGVGTPQTAASDMPTHAFYLKYQDTIEPQTIESLVDVFYYVAFPLRPYFHWPTYRAQVQEQAYRSDWGVFIITMAVCCLAAGRLNDGIQIPENLRSLHLDSSSLVKECHNAAIEAIPKELTEVVDWYSLMKAKALLASACLQNEDIKRAIVHGGEYISLSTTRGFHDEANWPNDLNERDRQERRRLVGKQEPPNLSSQLKSMSPQIC